MPLIARTKDMPSSKLTQTFIVEMKPQDWPSVPTGGRCLPAFKTVDVDLRVMKLIRHVAAC